MTRNKICVMDTETTGLTAGFNEIVQWSAICIDPDTYTPDPRVFDVRIKPEFPERGVEAQLVHKLDYSVGIDKYAALKEFILWINLHKIRRVIPLGHNIQFDLKFLLELFMDELFNKTINHSPRDTMQLGHIINDWHSMNGFEKPFKFLKLEKLGKRLGVSEKLLTDAHDSLIDCRITWEVYKKLMKKMSKLGGYL